LSESWDDETAFGVKSRKVERIWSKKQEPGGVRGIVMWSWDESQELVPKDAWMPESLPISETCQLAW